MNCITLWVSHPALAHVAKCDGHLLYRGDPAADSDG